MTSRCLGLFVVVLLVPGVTAAQSDSNIAGVVRDPSGAVLPGVTVEAASPVLIEKVRTAVTDGQGQYRIVNLRPGRYAVTFSLAGFSVVRRENIELAGSFTANVNAELAVGGLEETVTVTGAGPTVDIQNTVRRSVLNHEVIDFLPTGKVSHQMAALIPGARVANPGSGRVQDVGGASGESLAEGVLIYNSRSVDNMTMIDGLRINGASMSGGGGHGIKGNPGATQEIVVETSGVSAEHELGGVRTNVIPKEGGNTFSSYVAADFTNSNLYSDNLTDQLIARGIAGVTKVDRVWSINPATGGRIKRDKVWIYTGGNYRISSTAPTDVFYDTDPTDFVFTPDLGRPNIADNWTLDTSVRVTSQVTPRNKVNGFFAYGDFCYCQQNLSPQVTYAATAAYRYKPNYLYQISWTSPVSNRLLLEAGASRPLVDTWSDVQDGVSRDLVGVTELSTGVQFRSRTSAFPRKSRQWNLHSRFALSYVTGSHTLKVGVTNATGGRSIRTLINDQSLSYTVLNGVPTAVTQWLAPLVYTVNQRRNVGVFAQDQWTLKRLTFNVGVRLDHLNAFVKDQSTPATRFTSAQTYKGVENLPNWTNISPRVGVSYNLFGSGRTALKGHIGHFVVGEQTGIAQANNPVNTIVTSALRTWSDQNRNFVPDCDFSDRAVNGECGALANNGFGTPVVRQRYDPEYLEGWDKRQGNWESAVGIQHELVTGLAMGLWYHRRAYTNFTATQNVLVSGSDYDRYCITAPVDSRLPGGGGNEICGFYDVKPAKFGQVDSLVTSTGRFGKQSEVYDGIDVVLNGRLPNGGSINGGLSTGRVLLDNCAVVAALGAGAFDGQAGPSQVGCRIAPPFWRPEIKVLASYPLRWGLTLSAVVQSVPGPEVRASYVATNAQVAPSLGRDFAAGARGTALHSLIQPGTLYDEGFNQVDLRLTKQFKWGGGHRLLGTVDAYNAFNSSGILGLNTRYGSAWLRPTSVLTGRLIKFGVQVDF